MTPSAAPQELRARADAVLELHEAGELEQALTACDELLGLVPDEPDGRTDPVVRESVFTARFERALLLTELGDLDDAADAYAAAADTVADLDDPDQRHEIAMALLNRGICLDTLGAHDEALVVYADLEERFGAADDPVTRDQVLRGRVNRAAALLAVDRPQEALTVVEELVGVLGPADALEAEQLAIALRVRAAALQAVGDAERAAVALADVERCSADDPAVRTQMAAAQRERADLLAGLGRDDEAVTVLEATVDRIGEDPDPVVAEAVAELLEVEAELLERRGDPERAADVRARVAG